MFGSVDDFLYFCGMLVCPETEMKSDIGYI